MHRLAGAALLWLSCANPVFAQDPFRALADHLTARGPYKGPTVGLQVDVLRPAAGDVRWCSLERPLCVHGDGPGDAAAAPHVLAALEQGYDWLVRERWPLPYPDGGAGGTLAFDVYLASDVTQGAGAHPEQLATATPLDAATSFALLDRGLPDDALPACALAALAEAGLLARDPAEPAQVRHASAAVATWRAHGELGCAGDPAGAQRQAHLGLLGDAPEQVASAALWLLWLDHRHQRGSGELVRELWELAAQRSDAPSRLHARPTVWEALARVLERAGETLDGDAAEFALQRALAPEALGLRASDRAPLLATLRPGPRGGAVSSRDPLGSYGSAYVLVPTPGARTGRQLRVWLRAEPDSRWSLLAARLDVRGHVLSQLSAPPRTVPESYLPVELDDDTDAVLIAVTALPLSKPGPATALDEHHFRLTVALSGP